MAKNKETELVERERLAVSMPVEDWQEVFYAVSREYPDVAGAILSDLQDCLEGYSEPGPTVELSSDEWRRVLTVVEQAGFEELAAELTFQLIEQE